MRKLVTFDPVTYRGSRGPGELVVDYTWSRDLVCD